MYDYRPTYFDETDCGLGRLIRLGTAAFMIWLINFWILIATVGTITFILA